MRLRPWWSRRRPRSSWELRYEWHPVYGLGPYWVEHRPEDNPFLRSRRTPEHTRTPRA